VEVKKKKNAKRWGSLARKRKKKEERVVVAKTDTAVCAETRGSALEPP